MTEPAASQRRWIILFALAAVAASALAGFLFAGPQGRGLAAWLKAQQKGGSAFDLWQGRAAPPLELTTFDGRELGRLAGRPVVLDVWAAWSPPSRANLALLEAWSRERPDVLVLGVARDDPAAARALAVELGITYPLAPFPASAPAPYSQIIALPTTFLIDATGRILRVTGGYLDRALLEQTFPRP